MASGTEEARYEVQVAYYGPPEGAAAEAARLYAALPENAGLFADNLPCAGLLPALRAAGVWLHLLSAEEVSAAAFEFKALVRGRKVIAGAHPALRDAMRSAMPRALAGAFAFDRRKPEADHSPAQRGQFRAARREGARGRARRLGRLTRPITGFSCSSAEPLV